MIMLEPCKFCGKKDCITVTDTPFIFKGEEIRHRFRIECMRCASSIDGVADDQDRIRMAWNGMNRKPERKV